MSFTPIKKETHTLNVIPNYMDCVPATGAAPAFHGLKDH